MSFIGIFNKCMFYNKYSGYVLKDGRISRDIQWVCQFEEALVQPARTVMDINTLEFAAGKR